MKKVGITGGIGAGKSIVCEIFRTLNIPVFNSDLESKNLLNINPGLKKELIKHFGEDIYHANGTINREQFGTIIFNDKKKLAHANSLIHPAVQEHFEQWCTIHSEKIYVIKEAAILFESGAYRHVDTVIAVSAPENTRIARIMKRDNCSEYEVKSRIEKQWPQKRIIKMADFVIHNDGIKMLIPQVLKIHENLLR